MKYYIYYYTIFLNKNSHSAAAPMDRPPPCRRKTPGKKALAMEAFARALRQIPPAPLRKMLSAWLLRVSLSGFFN